MSNFDRSIFYPKKNKILNNEISLVLKENLIDKNIKNKFFIDDVSSLKIFRDNSIIFLNDKINPLPSFHSLNVNIITNSIEIFNKYINENIHFVKDLSLSYNQILNYLFFHDDQKNLPDVYKEKKGSFISDFANIDPTTEILNNCTISRGVTIGKNCLIKNNTVIKNSIIGDNVIIGDNCTIGSTGFGFDLGNMGANNISPHIGIVVINDNVSIGSNCTIDRGKIDITIIGKNSMLDNLIHVGHNVEMGCNVCIAAQTGISGSVLIGNNVTIGGQVGIAGHLKIGNNVLIAAKSGITKNIADHSKVAGFPAVDIKEWKRNIIKQKKYGHN